MKFRAPLVLATLVFLAASCRTEKHEEPGFHELVPAHDRNAAPNVVELDLVAKETDLEVVPGVRSHLWTYNDQFPGPLIEANVGDTLIVHFRNELPVATTIHWHGLRIPDAMDGVTMMTAPVEPGGSFEYQFTLPDAGMFWYHPHVSTDKELPRGLYGAIVVHGPGEPSVSATRTLVFSDAMFRGDGSIGVGGGMMSDMDGFEGSSLLVNGRLAESTILPIRAGEIQRWRLVNAAGARYLDLSLPGHTFHVIGTDGGLLQEPYDTDRLLIVPGQRYDLLVRGTGTPGSDVALKSLPHDRGQMNTEASHTLATLRYSNATPLAAASFPVVSRAIEALPTGAPERMFDITDAGMSFAINGEQWPNVTTTQISLGADEVWTLKNDSHMDHPFHLHGQFFQPFEKDGVALPRREWHDTVNVPMSSTVKVAVRHGNPGMWMFHCHILTHADNGMAGMIDVQPAP